LPAAVRAIKKRKKSSPVAYSHADRIPPTSNTVERFFSVCIQVYTKYQKRLLPVNLEMKKASTQRIYFFNNRDTKFLYFLTNDSPKKS
jgi:hypothetical protein